MTTTITLTVFNGAERHELTVPTGSNLRQVLLAHDLSPYARLTQRANCGGRGLCATCGVWLDDAPALNQWHDKLASQFGYPRLSCQITVERDLTIHLIPEKWIWGGRKR
jgi:ferredoxin